MVLSAGGLRIQSYRLLRHLAMNCLSVSDVSSVVCWCFCHPKSPALRQSLGLCQFFWLLAIWSLKCPVLAIWSLECPVLAIWSLEFPEASQISMSLTHPRYHETAPCSSGRACCGGATLGLLNPENNEREGLGDMWGKAPSHHLKLSKVGKTARQERQTKTDEWTARH